MYAVRAPNTARGTASACRSPYQHPIAAARVGSCVASQSNNNTQKYVLLYAPCVRGLPVKTATGSQPRFWPPLLLFIGPFLPPHPPPPDSALRSTVFAARIRASMLGRLIKWEATLVLLVGINRGNAKKI